MKLQQILSIGIILLAGTILTACDSSNSQPSTSAWVPTLYPTSTPLPPTATRIPSIQFGPNVSQEVQIFERDYSLSFSILAQKLTSGLYVLYYVKSDDNYEIWGKPMDSEPERLLSCNHCPDSFNELYYIQDLNSRIITITAYNPSEGDSLIIIDLEAGSAKKVGCIVISSGPYECRALPPRTKEWLTFGLYETGTKIPVSYFFRDSSEEWSAITGALLDSPAVQELAWHPDGDGFTFSSQSTSCENQRSLYYLSFDERKLIDWSSFLCMLDKENADFVGWSQDSTQVALVWSKPISEDPLALENLDEIMVCPVRALTRSDPSACRVVIDELYVEMPYFFLGYFGDPQLGVIDSFQWLGNTKFLWVKSPQAGDYTTMIGIIDEYGLVRLIYQGGLAEHLRLSPDGHWLLFYNGSFVAINIDNGSEVLLDLPDSARGQNWLMIP